MKDNEMEFIVSKDRLHDETMLTIAMDYARDDVETTMKMMEIVEKYSREQAESMQKAEEIVNSFKEIFPRLDYMTSKTGYNIGELNTELAKLRPIASYKINPLYHDYIRPLVYPGSEMDYEAMAKRLKALADTKEEHNLKHLATKYGNLEAPRGGRFNIRK